MKLSEIQQLWSVDSKIDRTELGEESLKIPQLHSKYFNVYSTERLLYKQFEAEYKKLYRLKYEYYMGQLSKDELVEHNWEPYQLKILKSDVPMYIDADNDVSDLKRKIHIQEEKLEFLESIIKSLGNRGFQLKTAVDWIKFTQGA